MSEANLWSRLQPGLKAAGLGTERLTDRTPGVPDVLYTSASGVTGLCELKWLAAPPRNLMRTPLLTFGPHGLTPEQANWAYRWVRRGGRAGVLLYIKSTQEHWYWRAQPEAWWPTWIRTAEANLSNLETAAHRSREAPRVLSPGSFSYPALIALLTA